MPNKSPSYPVVNLLTLSTEQLQALCQHLFRGHEVIWRCHGGFLARAAEMDLPPEGFALIRQYSELVNDTFGVTLTGINEILENDIGAPPAGGMQ